MYKAPFFRRIGLALLATLVPAAATLEARPLFEIQTDVPSIGGGGSSLPDLIEDFIRVREDFSGLDALADYNATLHYAGVAGAIEIEVAQFGNEATLHIPSTGFSRTFTGASRDEIHQQIEDFIQDEGAREWGRFNREMNRHSLVAVTDGNPNSTTARTAEATFQEFGTRPGRTRGERYHGGSVRGRVGFSLFPGYSRFEAGDFKGEAYSLHLAGRFRFNERFSLALLAPVSYLKVEDATVYRAGVTAGVPVTLIPDRPRAPIFWQVTPSAGLTGAGSVDFAAGGLVEHYTATSLLSYNLQNVTLSMGNQYGVYRGRNTSYDDYEFDTDLNQRIVRNGLSVSVPLPGRFVVDVFGRETRFRREAAMDRYRELGGDVVFRFGGRSAARPGRGYLKAGLAREFGNDYKALKGQAGLGLRF